MNLRILHIQNAQDWLEQTSWLALRSEPDPEVENAVREIIENVAVNGDDALIKYTRQFDCSEFDGSFKVSEKETAKAAISVPAIQREQITMAAANIRTFHEAQLEKSWFITRPDGTILGQRVLPIESVGLYVPGGAGGNNPLISSLLMNAIPAQVAGVKRIAIATPPREDGTVNPILLAAAHLLDIDEVYCVGGPWSIAAFAFGTQTIPKADLIAGPGNIFVTTAKRLLQGRVGIDMIAGPSEVLVIADQSANPSFIAADMLSQAEHDPLASAICLTDDTHLAELISQEVEKQLTSLPRGAIATEALNNWSCIAVTPNIKTAVEISNLVAPEHLEICCREPWSIMPQILHAGAIFMGQNSPEPVGDYFAGPNHVLPTLGTARFSSALSVQTFCKKSSIISASKSFLRNNFQAIASLARLEGLEAHARSVEARSCEGRRGF